MSRVLAVAGLLMGSASVFAQPGTVVGTASGNPGDPVTVSVDYLGTGSGVAGVQMDINYDAVNLTMLDLTSCGGTLGGATISCADQGGGVIRLAGFDGALNEIPSGSLGTVSFTILGTVVPVMVFPLTVSGEAYGDNGGNPVAPVGTVNGSVTAQAGPQPDITANPTTAAFGTVTQNSSPAAIVVAISNTGDPLAGNLTGNCAYTGDAAITAAPLALNVALGASVNATFNCVTTAAGPFTGSYDCTGLNASSGATLSIPASCTVAAATSSVTPSRADGSTLLISVNGLGGTGTTSVSFTETNNEGLAASVSCVISAGTGMNPMPGLFTITNPGGPIASGGSTSVTVSGTATDATGTASLDCTVVDSTGFTVSYPLGFNVRPLVVPTLSQWGMILMALGLVGFAGFRLRRQTNV